MLVLSRSTIAPVHRNREPPPLHNTYSNIVWEVVHEEGVGIGLITAHTTPHIIVLGIAIMASTMASTIGAVLITLVDTLVTDHTFVVPGVCITGVRRRHMVLLLVAVVVTLLQASVWQGTGVAAVAASPSPLEQEQDRLPLSWLTRRQHPTGWSLFQATKTRTQPSSCQR